MATIIPFTVKKPTEYDPANPTPAPGSFHLNFAPATNGTPAFYVSPDDVAVGINVPMDGITTTGTFHLTFHLEAVRYLLANVRAIAKLALAIPGSKGKVVKVINDQGIETNAQAMQVAEAEGVHAFADGILIEGIVILGEGINKGDEFPYSDNDLGIANRIVAILDCPKRILPGGIVENTIKCSDLPLKTAGEKQREKNRAAQPFKRLPEYNPS